MTPSALVRIPQLHKLTRKADTQTSYWQSTNTRLLLGSMQRNGKNTLFLRAERESDGTRTFKLVEAEPLETSYGEDLYDQIFGEQSGIEQSDRESAALPASDRIASG
jgi:hypothetical protein